jgi:hypothetical protein
MYPNPEELLQIRLQRIAFSNIIAILVKTLHNCCGSVSVFFSTYLKHVNFLYATILAVVLCVQHTIGHAQDTRVVVENAKYSTSEKPVVLIKWYSKELIYDEGVILYRRQQGALNWVRINEKPILKKTVVDPAISSADPDMEMFVSIIKSASKKDLQEGMLVFNLLIKSFQSNAFADFMGIYFEDRDVSPERDYEYKVNRIKNGKEFLLGISPVVQTGTYREGAPVQHVEASQTGKKLSINWKHEDDRYYAVNVYRKSSTDQAAIKLNETPLMLSQVPDSSGNLAYPKPMFSEDRNLEENKSYTYQLSGVGFFGNETKLSDPVEVKFVDVTPPPPPRKLLGKADSMKVYLKWENVDVADLKGMNVHRSRRSDGPFEIINSAPLSLNTPHYNDSLLLPGPYYYFVSANDESGNQAHSDLIFVEVQDVIPPQQPQDLKIEIDTGRIHLSWKMGIEPDLAGYYIYRTVNKHQKKNYVLINAEPLKEHHFTQDLPKNVRNEFFYYLVAVDTSFNRSVPSAHVSGAMPDILAPEKPFIKDISFSEESIVVEWIPNVDTDLAGYHVYRADTAKRFERININLLGKETFRYTDRSNLSNTDYFYYMVAVDSAGNSSQASKEKYARRVVKQDLQAGQIDLKIKYSKRKNHSQLSWKYVADETPVLGYVVYRGEQENRLQPITGLIKTKSFLDKINTKNMKEQYYQVRAYADTGIIYSSVIKQNL